MNRTAFLIGAAAFLIPAAALAGSPVTICDPTNTFCANVTSSGIPVTGSLSIAPTYYATFNANSSPITVSSTATATAPSRASRSSVTVENEQAVAMRCGPVNTVTFAGGGSTTGGILIPGVIGASWTWPNMTSAIWCITSSTSTTASVSETY